MADGFSAKKRFRRFCISTRLNGRLLAHHSSPLSAVTWLLYPHPSSYSIISICIGFLLVIVSHQAGPVCQRPGRPRFEKLTPPALYCSAPKPGGCGGSDVYSIPAALRNAARSSLASA